MTTAIEVSDKYQVPLGVHAFSPSLGGVESQHTPDCQLEYSHTICWEKLGVHDVYASVYKCSSTHPPEVAKHHVVAASENYWTPSGWEFSAD